MLVYLDVLCELTRGVLPQEALHINQALRLPFSPVVSTKPYGFAGDVDQTCDPRTKIYELQWEGRLWYRTPMSLLRPA
jgi:hypothetical protein